MSDCIEWQGPRNSGGYGNAWREGKSWKAHRWAWTEVHGPIPDGMDVLHHCDNPPCINVDHLWLGTARDNIADMDAKGRRVVTAGSRHGLAKLSETDIPVIRARLAAGEPQTAISDSYGVSQVAISKVHLGKTWRHI